LVFDIADEINFTCHLPIAKETTCGTYPLEISL